MSAMSNSANPNGLREVTAKEADTITGGGIIRWLKEAVIYVADKIK